jgi:hypothetical protein
MKSALVFGRWLDAAAERHVDPYTVWSLQTRFRQLFRDSKPPEFLDFIVELEQPLDDDDSVWQAKALIPAIYRELMPGSSFRSRHITVRIPVPPEGPQRVVDAVYALMFHAKVKRAQIGLSRPQLNLPAADAVPVRASRKQPASPPAVLLGVIEDGCPFGHPALASSRTGQTRVLALWDQSGRPAGSDDEPPDALGYGRERSQAELNVLLDEHRDGKGIDEESLYADPRSLQPPLPGRSSHAAAVVTLLGGRTSLLPHRSSVLPGDPDAASDLGASETDDAASTAPLAVVQFPREQIDIAGARWLVVRALDALRYLAALSSSQAGAAEKPVPLVVNISYGSMVGAHDGTALFETAMAELAEAHRRMAIVLAAGNSHGTGRVRDGTDALQRAPGGRHAAHPHLAPGERRTIRLYVPPSKPIETYLELWFEDLDLQAASPFVDGGDLAVLARSPAGAELEVKQFPGHDFDHAEPDRTSAGLMCYPRVAQSQRRSMALLVVAATQVSSTRIEGPSGVWTVEVWNRSRQRSFKLEAWVERDLLSGLARRSQAARILPETEDAVTPLNDHNTFNNIATGAGTFRVGALTAVGPLGRSSISAYSAAAATAESGPEFSAVADESAVRPGIRVSGRHSGMVHRMNGTSVAAPQAARWLANRLAAGESLEQLRKEIASRGPADARRGFEVVGVGGVRS